MANKHAMIDLLSKYPAYRDALFCRGYLITDSENTDENDYPFYGNWKSETVGTYKVLVHKDQDHILFSADGVSFLLIGHAYNPFNMVWDENLLLEQCAAAYRNSREEMFACIHEWTGIFALFIFDKTVLAVQDCAGIKGVIFGKVGNDTVFTSHAQLVADLYGLEMDPYVKKLIANRFYHIGNRYLPGNLTPYTPLRRMGANVYLEADEEFKIRRFFPTKPHPTVTTEEEYRETIKKAYEILHNGLELVTKKWSNAHISLSGGTDSKTTLSCANGLYDKFGYYSFESKDTEIVDAAAAKSICQKIGVDHTVYKIPSTNDEVQDYDILKQIIYHSFGYIRGLADHEVRKHIYFYRKKDIEVEVKSWCSEIVRVFFDRKYGLTMPKKLSPRHFSIFQTRYFLSPSLLRGSDRYYRELMKEYDLKEPKFNYEHTDLYYWEVRMSSWGMLVTTSLDLCHRLTFPFNNRALIELLLSVPREKRITDIMHNDIIRFANKDIFDADVHIKNNYFKSKRILLEKSYYYFRTLFCRKK